MFPFFIGWLLPYIFGHEIRVWTLYVGFTLIILGLFSPNNLKYFYIKWMEFGNALAFINSYIILGIFFFINNAANSNNNENI